MTPKRCMSIISLTILIQLQIILCAPPEEASYTEVVTDFPEYREDRLVGGIPMLASKQFSFMASVMYYGKHQCGGTIYSKDIILTAAHCVEARWIEKMSVRVGSLRSDYGGQIHKVSKVAHPVDYIHGQSDYDIAVLRVEPSIDFETRVEPVRLYNRNEQVGHKTKGLTLGWGLTEFPSKSAFSKPSPLLQGLEMWAYSPEYCYEWYNVQGLKQFCTWAGGKTACSGDSGGPFLVQKDGKWRQAGVYSVSQCHLGRAGSMVWTEVASNLDWIEEESSALLIPSQLPYLRRPFSANKKEYFRKNRGDQISSSDAPWIVAIESGTYQDLECSGAIVHRRHVLTTASCVNKDEKYIVSAGSNSPQGSQKYEVTKVVHHKDYHNHSGDIPVNDIAVLRVDRDFEFSDHVSQIDMADKDEPVIRSFSASMYFWRFEVDESGDAGNVLYSLPIQMNVRDECNGIYEQSDEGHVPEKQICGSNYIGMCMELKGGPLVIEEYSKPRLFGVYSWKKYCEDPQFPNVFTEVSSYRAWIQDCFTDNSSPVRDTYTISDL